MLKSSNFIIISGYGLCSFPYAPKMPRSKSVHMLIPSRTHNTVDSIILDIAVPELGLPDFRRRPHRAPR